ncbi:DUF6882 domain-containing protein [Corynebacterium pygosceleis]|uniref:DUF6882 domain-containing protein n=1 Tax=Corynebacterium pygosceleis TaxID=2800406 RepID=UPI00200668E4|nr:DUF6882 domain-containing protein [Corynebacterium pygosceleis]MCK7675802.1 hypothetical protein [Corynebacterium pygosceleis]
MEHPPPRSLAEIVTDGAIARADADAAFAAVLGDHAGIEFNRDGNRMQVRAVRNRDRDIDTTGTVVAEIRDGLWTWCSDTAAAAAERFGIPELTGAQPVSDDLVAAARTLHYCTPCFLAPMLDGCTAVVCLDPPQPTGDTRTAMITAATIPGCTGDLPRSLSGFAAIRGLDVTSDGSVWRFSDGTAVRVRDGLLRDISGGLDIDEIRADALLPSVESQMYLDARVPGATAAVDPHRGLVTLRDVDGAEAHARGVILATVTGDTWCWGWADRHIGRSPSTSACHRIRDFGRREGVPAFVSPTVPLALARELDLVSAAKPVLGMWYHATVQLDSDTWAVVVFADAALALPPPTVRAVEAVIDVVRDAVPDGVDGHRAIAGYARFRGLRPLPTGDPGSVSLPVTDGTVTVRFSPGGGMTDTTAR